MKVLHLIWNAKFGGIEKLVYDLALAQKGGEEVEPHLFIAKKEGEFIDQFKATGVPLSFSNLKSGFDLNLSEYNKIRSLFKKYDIIHFHVYNPFIALCTIGLKCKIVFTEHGNFGLGRKKKRSDEFVHKTKKHFFKRLVSWITFNSRFTKEIAEGLYDLKNQKNMSVVYNGIQLQHDVKESTSTEIEALKTQLKDKFVVGTSSRFVAFKRIDRLIKAFAEMENIHQSVLLLVGDGILLEELKQQVEALNISDSVIFTGYVNNVRDYQQLMDVCVFPSQSEPFGLVAIETLSLNKPTLVFSDGGGLKEIIENIAEQDVVGDEAELTKRLEDYSSVPKDTLTADLARVHYANGFSIETACKKFTEVYNRL